MKEFRGFALSSLVSILVSCICITQELLLLTAFAMQHHSCRGRAGRGRGRETGKIRSVWGNSMRHSARASLSANAVRNSSDVSLAGFCRLTLLRVDSSTDIVVL